MNFTLGTAGERTVFPLVVDRRDRLAPADRHARRSSTSFAAGARRSSPAPSATIAFGSYASPDYENARRGDPGRRHAGPAPRLSQSDEPGRSSRSSMPVRRRRRRAAGRSRSSATASPTSKNGAPWAVAVVARARRDRDDRDQRRRPRLRPGRHVHGHAHGGGPPVTSAGRRPRRSTRTATARSTRPRASAPIGAQLADRQPRRPAPDDDRPDAARPACCRPASTSTATAPPT